MKYADFLKLGRAERCELIRAAMALPEHVAAAESARAKGAPAPMPALVAELRATASKAEGSKLNQALEDVAVLASTSPAFAGRRSDIARAHAEDSAARRAAAETAAREARYRAWSALAMEGDPEAAVEFAGATAYDREQLVRALGSSQLATWARAQPPEMQALVLAAFRGDAAALKAQLVRDEHVTPFVRLSLRRDERGGRPFVRTNGHDITSAQADRLERLGLRRLVKHAATNGDKRYCGLSIEPGTTMSADALAAVRAVDGELNRAIETGEVSIASVPLEESRARAIAGEM